MLARSLTFRAVIALLLLFFFYGFGLVVGLGLVGAGVLIVVESPRVPVKLVLILIVAGGSVLWSLVPRFSKWVAPGPRLEEKDQPRLFALIRQVAQQMGQPMPQEVYLFPEVNAFVANVGGFLGLGGKRVMGVGLGLLAVDNVSQVKATLAHEFGHFAGGDTKLGGLTYATRSVMIRTLENLAKQGSVLVKPFEWLFKLYLRITQAISRQQELIADEWSVRIAGKTAHVTGLRQEAVHGASFGLFLQHEVHPLAVFGVTPKNVFEGFRKFSSSSTMKRLEPALAKALAESKGNAFDSHPPLEERIAYAHGLALPDLPVDKTPGTSLLDRIEELEAQFSGAINPDLKPVDWSEVGPALARGLERRAARVQVRVPGMTVQRALDVLARPQERDAFAEALDPHLIRWTLPDRKQQVEESVAGGLEAYLGILVAARGFSWHTTPGEALELKRDELTVAMRPLLMEILEGKKGVEALAALLDQAGVERHAVLPVTQEVRSAVLEPNCEVELEGSGKKVTVRAPLQPLMLPRCCGVCLGSAVEVVPTRFQLGGFLKSSDQWVELPVPVCAEHRKKAGKALDAKSYEASTARLVFVVPSQEYAELIVQVNR
ncbi:MAG: M48 family metallopeptidase [Myxococcota bacterium]